MFSFIPSSLMVHGVINFACIMLGHYVPQLAKKILDHNKGSSEHVVNLKGFIVSMIIGDKQTYIQT